MQPNLQHWSCWWQTWSNSAWTDDDQNFTAYLQHIIHNNVSFIKKLFLYSKLHMYINKYVNISENKHKLTMKICIIHFDYRLLWKKFAHKFLAEFLKEVILVLSKCYCHHLVENSILYKKKIYSTSTKDQYFFHKIKSYGRWSSEK